MEKIQLLAFVFMLTWSVWDLFVAGYKDGKPKKISHIDTFITSIAHVIILYFGGFFVVLGLSQIIWFVLTVVGTLAIYKGYIEKESKFCFGNTLFANIVIWIVYTSGGFWYKGFVPFQ